MSLNIKSREAHELAAELARLTGESMTKAVTEALRERLERKRRERAPALNFGDCVAYALAETTGEPLLFKGDDYGYPAVPASRQLIAWLRLLLTS